MYCLACFPEDLPKEQYSESEWADTNMSLTPGPVCVLPDTLALRSSEERLVPRESSPVLVRLDVRHCWSSSAEPSFFAWELPPLRPLPEDAVLDGRFPGTIMHAEGGPEPGTFDGRPGSFRFVTTTAVDAYSMPEDLTGVPMPAAEDVRILSSARSLPIMAVSAEKDLNLVSPLPEEEEPVLDLPLLEWIASWRLLSADLPNLLDDCPPLLLLSLDFSDSVEFVLDCWCCKSCCWTYFFQFAADCR